MIALRMWAQQRGVTGVTVWRWRNLGWLKTINISGRQYVSDEASAEFNRRAESGEFAKVHQAPGRKHAEAA